MVQISVVIPVHNEIRHLGACLDSLRSQTFVDFEVICVDDESTDGSLEILKKYAELDSRFTYLIQKRSGAGAARNLGMNKVTGKYLYFLDADDLLYPQAFELLHTVAEAQTTDIVLFQYQALDEETGRILEKSRGINDWNLPEDAVFSGLDASEKLFQITTPEPWIKFYLRAFVVASGLEFQNLPRANDMFFTWGSLVTAQRIVALADTLIIHRINLGDNLQKQNDETPLSFMNALEAIEDFLHERSLWGEDIKRSFINAVLDVSLYNLSTLNDEENLQKVFNAVKKRLVDDFKADKFGRDYFYYSDHAEQLALMCDMNCEEYFFSSYRRARMEHKIVNIEKRRRTKLLKQAEKQWTQVTSTRSHRTELRAKRISRRFQKLGQMRQGEK